jgi:voltage-gated potassium channel
MDENPSSRRPAISAYDLFLFILAILSLINLLLWAIVSSDAAVRSIISVFDSLIALIFLFDFFRNLYIAPDRRAYMKWGWLDFLGGIPFTGFAIFRLARAVRVVRVMRQVGGREIIRSIRIRLAHHVFITALILMSIVVVFGGILVQRFEEHSPDSTIETPGEAIWWAIVTITTVGYGDEIPVSEGGKIMAVIVMILGVGLASLLTGLVARVFISSGTEDDLATKADIESLRAEIVALRNQIRGDE